MKEIICSDEKCENKPSKYFINKSGNYVFRCENHIRSYFKRYKEYGLQYFVEKAIGEKDKK